MTKNSRPGCLSTPGIILVVLTAFIIAGFVLAKGGMIFTPGGLNAQTGASLRGVRSHAEFTNQCGLCHAPFWSTSTMADRCLICHSDVAVQLLVPFSLHATLYREAPGQTCRSCHGEHHGPLGSLTNFDVVPFPHDVVGYSLTSHQTKSDGTPFICRDCHVQTDQEFDQAICKDCHTRIEGASMRSHSQVFGSNCLACHTGSDPYGRNFDHGVVPFPLTGKHAQVPCGQCHINELTLAELKSTPQDCISCHAAKDVHQGRLGSACGSCHAATGWLPASFDHDLSVFKLTGTHTALACESCHKNAIYNGTPTDCISCHAADDAHKGNLGSQCASCHTTISWSPIPFNHNRFIFKLSGRHATLSCESCHVNAAFKGTPTTCISCHATDDTHNGNLGPLCGNCHTTSDWTPLPFDHNQFVFDLTGKHTTLPCDSCHLNAVFKGTPSQCISCHSSKDIHKGNLGPLCGNCHTTRNWTPLPFDHDQFTFKLTGKHATLTCESCHINAVFKGTPGDCISCHAAKDIHKGNLGPLCANCHTTTDWTPVPFDHNQFAFKLTGKHATLTCESCHVNAVFKGTPTDCNSCHAADDAHNGSLGEDCASCHTTSGWKPSTYDHNLSSFKLTGKHATLDCASCHLNSVYTGTPGDCNSCHAAQDVHHGTLGPGCSSCHTTSAWTPSTFDHRLTRLPLTGAHASLDCSQCHSGRVYNGLSPECVSCHSLGTNGHAGRYGTYCGSCHTTIDWTAHFTHPGSCDVGVNCDNHAILSCNECHPVDLGNATCTNCHISNSPPGGVQSDQIKLTIPGRPVYFSYTGITWFGGLDGPASFSFRGSSKDDLSSQAHVETTPEG